MTYPLELITLDPEFHRLFNLLSMHQVMIADQERTAKFRQAIFATVKPGDVVVDLGAGTGLLSFFAVQAGAGKVYAIERTDMIELAHEIAVANGWQDRIEFIQADARTVRLPRRADVVVSETIGHMGVAEGFLQNMAYAKRELVAPTGSLIPSEISIHVAPVTCTEFRAQVMFWQERHHGIDFSSARNAALKKPHIQHFDKSDLLARPRLVTKRSFRPTERVDAFVDALEASISSDLEFEIERQGEVDGLAGWFVAGLSEGNVIDTSPFATRTHWRQTLLPSREVISVRCGNAMSVSTKLDNGSGEGTWSWAIQYSG